MCSVKVFKDFKIKGKEGFQEIKDKSALTPQIQDDKALYSGQYLVYGMEDVCYQTGMHKIFDNRYEPPGHTTERICFKKLCK